MLDPAVSQFRGRDGVGLAYREVGEGRPLVLLHGLVGDATLWLRHGQAEAIAAHGHRVIEQWLRSSGEDPVALLHVLDSVVATPVEPVGRIQVPTLVVVGADDERAASADQLVAALPRGTRAVVPGDHSTAAAAPELAAAIVDFLA